MESYERECPGISGVGGRVVHAVRAGGGAKGLRNMGSSRKLTQEWRRRG